MRMKHGITEDWRNLGLWFGVTLFVGGLSACATAPISTPEPVDTPAATQEDEASRPPTEPVLRIETGMHTAAIRRIDADAAGEYLVTASVDKTVRLWSLSAGRDQLRLLRVLRPPLGAGNEGKLYAVAISPDGQTIATGG